jgi:hypothetical protein
LLVAILSTGVLVGTSASLPMGWDEGNAIGRAEGIGHWMARWGADGPDTPQTAPLSRRAIAHDWRYTTRVEGHPAFYGIVIAAGRSIAPGCLGPLGQWRFGPMLFFGAATGAMFYRLGREYSWVAGAAGTMALMLLPRMFAHAHFASFDGPLTAAWVLAWALFAPARAGWPGKILWGIALGMTLGTKATGWIAPVPFLAWTLLYRDRAAAKTMAVGVPVALATFWLLNPPLWHDPIEGLWTFFRLNLDRSEYNISILFLGRMYNLDYPLPWYNTLFWTAVTVPLGTLLLMGTGLIAVFRHWRQDRAGLLLLANALVLLVVRALPGVPPHDGVRLFLPSFAFLAALAGVGTERLLAWSGTLQPPRRWTRPVTIAGVLLLYTGSAGSLFWYAPQWLSYYSLPIGGLRGATALGMEPTYYWDGLDRSVLDWLARHTAREEKVHFAAASTENLALLRRWGALPVEYRAQSPGRYRWYVVQHRPSAWQPADRRLIAEQEPAFVKTIRSGGWGPWRLDVPLVEVYSYQQYLQAREAVTKEGG